MGSRKNGPGPSFRELYEPIDCGDDLEAQIESFLSDEGDIAAQIDAFLSGNNGSSEETAQRGSKERGGENGRRNQENMERG